MCLEALSLGSSPCAWEASYTVESILHLVRMTWKKLVVCNVVLAVVCRPQTVRSCGLCRGGRSREAVARANLPPDTRLH